MKLATCSLVAELSMVTENILIQDQRITQLYVIQSHKDPFLWFGVLFVESGMYMGCVIRFNLVIPTNYPNSPCPKVFLDPIPYHPLIDPVTGELDTKNAFPNWISTTYKFHELLIFVKRLLYQPEIYMQQIENLLIQSGYRFKTNKAIGVDLGSSNQNELEANVSQNMETAHRVDSHNFSSDTNHKAYTDIEVLFTNYEHTIACMKHYLCDKQEFQRLIEVFKQKCSHQLYDKPNIPHGDDDNALIFTPWDPHLHEITRRCILKGNFAPRNLFASYNRETDRVSFIPGAESSP